LRGIVRRWTATAATAPFFLVLVNFALTRRGKFAGASVGSRGYPMGWLRWSRATDIARSARTIDTDRRDKTKSCDPRWSQLDDYVAISSKGDDHPSRSRRLHHVVRFPLTRLL